MASSTSEVSSLIQDPSNCFFLHPNENPSLILVSPPLTGSNYHHWSRAMMVALMSKNKYQFVDGSICVPEKDDPLFLVWQRCNTMVLAWLNRSLSPSIAQSVIWLNRAVDVWTDLRERFSHGDAFRVAELQEELYQFRQGDLSITEYFTRMKIIWDELLNYRPVSECSCLAKEYLRQDNVIRFLKGLNERFATVRSQIMLMEPLPPINKVFSLVIQQERELTGSLESVSVNLARTGSSSQPSTQWKSTNNNAKSCTYCGKPRHTVDTCYKKHGYPPGYKTRNRATVNNFVTSSGSSDGVLSTTSSATNNINTSISQDQYNQLLALLQPKHAVLQDTSASASVSPAIPPCVNQVSTLTLMPNSKSAGIYTALAFDSSNSWIIDSGATTHVCYSLTDYITYSKISPI